MAEKLGDIFKSKPLKLKPLNAKHSADIQNDIVERLSHFSGENEYAVALLKQLSASPEALGFLGNAFSLSSYLKDCALIKIGVLAECLVQPFSQTIDETVERTSLMWREHESASDLMAALRKAKRKMSLCLGLADMGGFLEPSVITASLSRFADAALTAVCSFLLLELHNSGKIALANIENPCEDSGLIILGMGKYGAFELNYSSDIDIILFFDVYRKTKILSDDPTSVFVRLAKQLSRLLQERTGDGYVFRVDLRLRPDPGSTPLAIPVETALNYYAAYGQNWERAAFIKARAVAGDVAAGQQFLKELAPFVWRKYLDFAAIQDVHSIKRQIHAHKGHGEIAVKGHNVKLGRGGIREIEFFVQTQQLIAGGRREQLRVISTIDGLNALCADGWITKEAATELTRAYWYLRCVEHRIQMVADEQSHTLPDDNKGLERIAFMMGAASVEAFSNDITKVMKCVETHYAALFEASPELTGKDGNLVFTGDDEDPGTLETLSEMGFKQPSQIISTVKGWHYGRYNSVRSGQARELLTELTPVLLGAFAETQTPDTSFFSFDRFLAGLPAGLQFFAILKSNANLIRLITLILGSAPRLSEIITRKPHVVDSLIDPSFTASVPEKTELKERLAITLDRLESYEAKLDQARIFAAEQKFLIGIRLINRTINSQQAGLAYTALAETLLECMMQVVRNEFEAKHGRISGGEIGILGMGRLGSRDLTAGSDLDLIFLYNHDEDAEASDGEKPLYPQQYFIRLVQRLIAAMSAPTAEGVIYELDFRLRPSGNSGPLATQLASFTKYQLTEAWTWESQAMVRARPIAGDMAILKDIERVVSNVRQQKRDIKKTAQDILEMRKTLDKEKPAKSIFDVKLASGGLIDIEFIAQWGVFKHPLDASTDYNPATIELIERIPEETLNLADKEELKNAYELYNSVLQIERVCLEGGFEPDGEEKGFPQLLLEQTSAPDLKVLRNLLSATQKSVRRIFKDALNLT
ncbi:MAG: bifunctional [glutamine synthetase] adenylyltransferase/[glutamine synthetase]-adenylyl-L-tyrosine phosphorylase [Salaquimonas sp.]